MGQAKTRCRQQSIEMIFIYSQTCTVQECAKLCFDQEGCDYFILGNGVFNGVDSTGASGGCAAISELTTNALCCMVAPGLGCL